MIQKVQYSSVLQDFATPLLNADDTTDQFITKLKIAELIWNYCIAKEFELPVFKILQKAITTQNENYPVMEQLFNQFVEMKEIDFYQYKNYIVNVEVRTGKLGNKTVYVNQFTRHILMKFIKAYLGLKKGRQL